MAGGAVRIITMANIKGGVGKTTATVNIAWLLATEFNKRVLVIDADDQGNATKALGVRHQHEETESLWYALRNRQNYAAVMVESAWDGIHVIPSTKELKGAQMAFGQSARGMKLFQRLLKDVENDFDYVLIDTKPQINILLQSALAASHWYIVPSFPEPDSYDGFVDLITECEEIYEEVNENLNCLGVLFTSVKASPAHEVYMKFILKYLRRARVPVFKSWIRSSNAVATGTLHNCPAVSMSSSRNTTEDYMKVTRQLMRASSRNVDEEARPDLETLGIFFYEDGDGGTVTEVRDLDLDL